MFTALPLVALCRLASAVTNTFPSTLVPPPPGQLTFSFPNPPLHGDASDASLSFSGGAGTQASMLESPHLTFRFFWTLPSGELTYSQPTIWILRPLELSTVNGSADPPGCPSNVGMVFTTDYRLGATVGGSLNVMCFPAIPEPGSLALFALAMSYFLTRRPRSPLTTTPSSYPTFSAPTH